MNKILTLTFGALVLMALVLSGCTVTQASRYNAMIGRAQTTLYSDAQTYTHLVCTFPDFDWTGLDGYDEVMQGEEADPCPTQPEYTSVEQIILDVFGPEVGPFAISVAWCESRHDPNATGRAGERGLFQLHPINRTWLAQRGFDFDQMYDPVQNVLAAKAMVDELGWGPWSCA